MFFAHYRCYYRTSGRVIIARWLYKCTFVHTHSSAHYSQEYIFFCCPFFFASFCRTNWKDTWQKSHAIHLLQFSECFLKIAAAKEKTNTTISCSMYKYRRRFGIESIFPISFEIWIFIIQRPKWIFVRARKKPRISSFTISNRRH